jgi:sarcosine oxidase subunit alpha
MRITRNTTRGRPLTIEVDGAALRTFEGETIATALLAAGVTGFRRDTSGRPRGLFCNMGTCSECLVTLQTPDGAPPRRLRACLTLVTEGLIVATGAADER